MSGKAAAIIIAASLVAGCGNVNAALKQSAEAQRLSADLLINSPRPLTRKPRRDGTLDALSVALVHRADE
jgi:hypothetical protein